MKHTDTEAQAWALAALFLAIDRLRAAAERGGIDDAAELTLIPSLLRTNAADIADYYGEPHDPLTRGRDAFLRVFNGKNDQQGLRYSAQILHVEKRLAKNPTLMALLQTRLQDARRQAEHFPPNHPNLLAGLATTYQDTASQAAGKIMVIGRPEYLQQTETINRVRTLLLCGVRAASLWRAYGGTRWNLLFARRKLEEALRGLVF